MIDIDLTLSSFYNVDHINILKTVDGSAYTFKTSLTHGLTYTYSDLITKGGVYVYQAEIVFNNGTTILSDPSELIIENPGKALIWPNPVTQENYLHITSGGNSKFRLLNEIGKIVYEKELTRFEEEVDVESLPSGFYIYQLINSKGITDVGRIIKI